MPRTSCLALSALLLLLGPSATTAQTFCQSVVPIAIRPAPGPEFQLGCTEYVAKYGGGSGTQGSWGALDLSALSSGDCSGSGGSTFYRCAWASGLGVCLDSLTCLPPLSGNMTGTTASAIEARFAADTDQRQGVCYFDPVASYHGNGSRLLVALMSGPLVGVGGGGCYTLIRPVRVFLTRVPGSGNRDLIFFNYLGDVTSDPTPAGTLTWGGVKRIYR
jgi:hypothetical protein